MFKIPAEYGRDTSSGKFKDILANSLTRCHASLLQMNQKLLELRWGHTTYQKMALVHGTLCTIPPHNTNKSSKQLGWFTKAYTVVESKQFAWGQLALNILCSSFIIMNQLDANESNLNGISTASVLLIVSSPELSFNTHVSTADLPSMKQGFMRTHCATRLETDKQRKQERRKNFT
jgi:hypothetical protein